ncbi:threonine/serine exporter family protein [Cellulomonas sp.]|uniref:threonine/serine ThrE exporter family protein n=1 Tax=Cellulomonas sp. TaxID=40001 RepID=UPI001B0429A0|nr:threonine/serine exporter family protein [Cellulomonas sp.]MBO9556354.1 threonine/serine exporter family protein [Cellulomonas sp.]
MTWSTGGVPSGVLGGAPDGVLGGVPGGVRGGAPDGVLGEVLGAQVVPTPGTTADVAAPTTEPTQPTVEPTPTTTEAPETPTPEPTDAVVPTQSATAPEPVPTPEESASAPAPTQPSPTSTSVDVPWTTDPAVQSSQIPLGAIVLAVLVLVGAAVALALAVRRARAARAATGMEGVREPPALTTAIGVLDADTRPTTVLSRSSSDAPTAVLPDLADDPTVVLPGLADDETAVPGAGPAGGGAGPPGGALTDAATGVPEHDPAIDTVRFLLVLGEAMVDSSAPVVQVTQTLERVGAINGAPDAEVVALPTALLVSVPGRTATQTAASTAGWRQLRLHQVQDVLAVADLAEAGAIGPVEGTARIREAVSAPPPYDARVRVLGYVAVCTGLAMILGGGLLDAVVAAVLGAAIAGIQLAAARMPAAYQALVVLTCAFVVSVAVFLLARTGLDIGLLAPLVAPLVTFLPGALLTTAAIDLATRQMIAGSARLAAGGMQLVLLALGITGAAALVGVPATELTAGQEPVLGWFGPWLGVLVFGVGVVFHHCARKPALPWIVLVLVVAYAGQVLGGLFFGGVFSAFVGALLMTPVAMFAATRPTGPPTLVGFLPGFWLLVPGALGLVGVTSILGESADALSTVVTAGITMVAISLGVLAGIALGSAIGRPGGPGLAKF